MAIVTMGLTVTILPIAMTMTVPHSETMTISMTISMTVTMAITMIVPMTDDHRYDDLVLVDVGMQHMAKNDVGTSELRGCTRARANEKPSRQ